MRRDMKKPYHSTTRQYVGAVHTLNETLAKMPPMFNNAQKVPPQDIVEILASNAPEKHKRLMTEQGFTPHTATVEAFVEISERAETKEAIGKAKYDRDNESDSSGSERPKKRSSTSKKKSKKDHYREKEREFYCSYHKANSTHDSSDCKVLKGSKEKPAWKKPDKAGYKDKYKNKSRDFNILQAEVKKEKDKYIKLRKKYAKDDSASEESSDESRKPAAKKGKDKDEVPKLSRREYDSSSSSSSESSSYKNNSTTNSSSTDSETE
jgi:hypothetical protein